MRFKFDNPVFEFLTTLSYFIALNVVFIITCIPIITIGPALTSLYYVTIRESQNEGGYLVRGYLKAFRKYFLQSFGAGLFFLVAGAVLLFNLAFWYALGTLPGTIFTVIILIALVTLFLCFIYTFPLLGRYDNKLKQTLKNALFIAIHNFKYTILLVLAYVALTALIFFYIYAAIFMVILGFAFCAYCMSFLFAKIFKRYDVTEEPEAEEQAELKSGGTA